MTDFRALCAELLCSLEQYPVQPPRDRDLIDRARAALAEPESIEDRIAKADAAIEASMKRIRTIAATPARNLAQPEPQGPTDEELLKTYCDARRAFYFEHAAGDSDQEDRKAAAIWGLRAVLARWGRPAIEPVPVAERLPGPEDCDAEGTCWLTSIDTDPGWVIDNPEKCTNWTHWLPHHALPVPQQGE
jgi:hypothetical protein